MFRRLISGVGWWGAITSPGPTRIVGINALVDAVGLGLTAVCFPFFAILVVGLNPAELAVMLAVAGTAELLAAVPNGALAGRFGVHRFVVLSKLVQAVAFAVIATGPGLLGLLPMAALAGLARAGSGGLNQTLTVAVLGEQARASALGIVRALKNIGYLVASSVSALLLAANSPVVLRVAVIGQVLALLLSAMLVARLRPRERVGRPSGLDFSVLRDWTYLGLVLSATAYMSSLAVLDIGLPLWVLEHSHLPRPMVAVVVIVNTVLVVALQYAFARRISTVPTAMRSLKLALVCLCLFAGLIAATPYLSTPLAVAALAVGAVALTLAELSESPSWWTLSYELAPAGRKDEYLAAFDLSLGLVWIVGPVAMAAVVAAGPGGWALYALVLVLATAATARLVGARLARMPTAVADPQPV